MVKVTFTVNSDNVTFSLPPFPPLPSHTPAEYMKPVCVECYRHQMTLPAASAERGVCAETPQEKWPVTCDFGNNIKQSSNGKMKAAAALKRSHTSSYKQTQCTR